MDLSMNSMTSIPWLCPIFQTQFAIFQLYGCEFYLECTPNGWDREGQCSVWLTSKCGMFGFESLTVAFTVECKEIGFKSEKLKAVISESGNGRSSVTTTHTM